jgi:Mg2+/Co2+ transporter CorC
VTEYLGHLPAAGERTMVGTFEFTVEQVSGHAVESVVARRVSVEPEEQVE